MCSEHGECLLVLAGTIIKTIEKANTGLSQDDVDKLAYQIYEDLFSGKLDDVIAKEARTR